MIVEAVNLTVLDIHIGNHDRLYACICCYRGDKGTGVREKLFVGLDMDTLSLKTIGIWENTCKHKLDRKSLRIFLVGNVYRKLALADIVVGISDVIGIAVF